MAWEVAMRIIAGKAGRIAIKVPKAVTRPTTDFVRQAVFSILGERVEGARVLDLFSGSGAVGLEDEHRAAEKILLENLAKSRLEGGRPVKADVHAWVTRDVGSYDLIFADPPYAKYPTDRDHLKELFTKGALADRLAEDGLLIAEQSTGEPVREAKGLKFLERREYGSSAILLYAKGEAS